MTASAEPLWIPDTVDQWILSATSAMNTTVATTQHPHRRRGAPLAAHRDESAGQERQHDPHHADDGRLPERDAEPQHKRAVTQPQDRDVRREPRPEQIMRAALALGLGDHVDAVHLHLERPHVGGGGSVGHGTAPLLGSYLHWLLLDHDG